MASRAVLRRNSRCLRRSVIPTLFVGPREVETRSILTAEGGFSLFFFCPAVGTGLFLHLLEPHEVPDFLPRLVGEAAEFGDERAVFGSRGLAFPEELADLQVEDLEQLEKRVQPDLVLALLHAREVRLGDADPFGELHLGQAMALAQLANARADEVHFAGGERSGHMGEMLLRHKSALL